MPVADTINGTVLGALIVSAVVAWPLTWLLLVTYRRQVVRAMHVAATGRRHGHTPAMGHAAATTVPRRADTAPFAGATLLSRDEVAAERARGDRRRATVWRRYALAAVVYAAILTVATLQSAQIAFLPVRTLTVWLAYLWPVVPTVAILSGFDRRVVSRALAGYVVTLVALGVLAGSPLGAVAIWVLLSGAPTVVVLVYLHRSVRAVAVLVVVVVFAGLLGALALTGFVGASDERMRLATDVAVRFGAGGVAAFAVIVVVGFAFAAVLGVVVLRVIGAAYRQHGLPADFVQIGSVWALFATAQGVPLAFESPVWSLTAPASFAAFLLITARRARVDDPAVRAPRLLLLRVFALGSRSEDMFRRVTTFWQDIGPIRLITGPDLARATVEPDEFLTFAAGRLDQLVVAGPDEVDAHDVDGARFRDRHGRYRIREHLCAGDAWRAVVARLVADTDLVLVDVRGFHRANIGTHHELVLLAQQGMLARTVLVVDATTDRDLVVAAISQGGADLRHATVIEVDADEVLPTAALVDAVPTHPG